MFAIQLRTGVRGVAGLLVIIALAIWAGAAVRWWMTLFILGGYGLILVNTGWTYSRNLKRFFALGPQIFDLHENGLRAFGGLSQGDWSWVVFRRFAESREFFLLFVTPSVALFMPKASFVSEGEVQVARDLLRQKIGKTAAAGEAA